METLTVQITGPGLSFLIRENVKNNFPHEGFLLGKLLSKKTSTITDNDQHQEYASYYIKISGPLPWPDSAYFYDGSGQLDYEKLNAFVGPHHSNTIGWYRFRPRPHPYPTFREKTVHKQLASYFNVPLNHFMFGTLSNSAAENGATHSFFHNFMICNNNVYTTVPIHIVNLNDPNNQFLIPESVTSKNVSLNTSKTHTNKKSDVNEIQDIEIIMQKRIETLINQVTDKDKELYTLQKELQNLKAEHLDTMMSNEI